MAAPRKLERCTKRSVLLAPTASKAFLDVIKVAFEAAADPKYPDQTSAAAVVANAIRSSLFYQDITGRDDWVDPRVENVEPAEESLGLATPVNVDFARLAGRVGGS